MKNMVLCSAAFVLLVSIGCNNNKKEEHAGEADTIATKTEELNLPAPYATRSASNYCDVIGWQQGKTPIVPDGFTVVAYATGLANPRNVYVAPNGDVFAVESNTQSKGIKDQLSGKAESQKLGNSANRITLLRDVNKDGVPDVRTVYLTGLNQPYGVLVLNNSFYVANTDGVWQYPYNPKDSVMKSPGKKIVELPAGGYNNHWTRNIIANKDGSKIFIAVGSGSDHADHGIANEVRRADILEINPDGSGEVIYAGGLRNPAGIAVQTSTGTLYTSVNERDELGDNLVPDYFTSVQKGGFYGWPYSYYGQHQDPRLKDSMRTDLVQKAIVPDVPLESHVAALGLTFYNGNMFPAKYKSGAFIGEHGSWNRSELSGYKVVFVPFEGGKPGKPEDFMTGFIADAKDRKVFGRPVNLTVLQDGSLLLADDSGNTIWRVTYR
jgi:glucose/arabinose dehydrogenase